jgi:isocitrate dehydrogenase
MTQPVPITVAYGDGIGPEIMEASLFILKEAGAKLDPHTIEIGEKVYLRGNPAGIDDSAWDTLRHSKVFLKAPITTPQGGGFKSLNVTARKALGLYANVRPCVSYHPFVATKYQKMDVVIVRENEEDTYGGIEHRQSHDVVQCLKLISRPGCEKIVRYAFEYARAYGRKKVTCLTKDNIMKMTDGLFHKVFDEIAPQYPEIQNEHWIVDIGMAKVAATPEEFDVIVLPNLYGDILSDITAQIAGSVGLAGSSNIGVHAAMFEAIHGSAPRRAGQNVANPSGLLLGAVMMLIHIGQSDVAEKIHNAWLRTIEDGVHTYDIFKEGVSKESVGTKEFAQAVVARLGKSPEKLKAVSYKQNAASKMHEAPAYVRSTEKREVVGVDAFIYFTGKARDLAQKLQPLEGEGLKLEAISNRGMAVWPRGMEETFCVDTYTCRFISEKPIVHGAIVNLLDRLAKANIEFLKTELLYNFDGKAGFSRGQGQ